MTSRVSIVDTGLANVGSVANMCRRLGGIVTVANDADSVHDAERIILPGVGAFDHAMAELRELGIDTALKDRAAAGVPILGICLGMQLLLDSSEEGVTPGLGLIGGAVRRLPSETSAGRVRIPHMGWGTLHVVRSHAVLESITPASRFYHVHSFAADPTDPDAVLATTRHGDPFVSVIGQANVVGAQFHPEKSHRHGKALLASFLSWQP